LLVDRIMGFEQLATLKTQLAKQADDDRLAEPVKAGRAAATSTITAPTAKQSTPVGPVVRSIAKLQKRFPTAFPRNPAPKVPLKVGIYQDLLEQAQELGLSETALRDAIKTWCRGSRYWACLVEDAVRVDLGGRAAGRVSPAQASRARWLAAQRARTIGAAQVSTSQ
jgi:ProP effector